jgi:hypothetical protein
MKGKGIRYALVFVLISFLFYNSVYIKKLSEYKTAETKPFDAAAYAREYVFKKFPAAAGQAVEIGTLVNVLKSNPDQAFKTYSHAQGPGDARYFMVKGQGEVIKISESHVFIKSSLTEVKIATEYILGSAARDGSGIISISEFDNTMALNDVSEAINSIIRKEILPSFEAKVKKGDNISFVGCIELSQSHPATDNIEIIPLILK